MNKPKYITWMVKEDACIPELKSNFNCFRIDYNKDPSDLDEWALHLRRNMISDDELLNGAKNYKITIEDYLRTYIVPQRHESMGPQMRSNIITEILFSDLLEYIYGYNVPRVKFYLTGKNQSPSGTDVIGYKFANKNGKPSTKDKLVTAEVKAALSKSDTSVIGAAIEHSLKDERRMAVTLDLLRRKLNLQGKINEAEKITRFLQKPTTDYQIDYIAAGITNIETVDKVNIDGQEKTAIHVTDQSKLVFYKGQDIFFVYGKDLMDLTHEVFERCVR